MPRTRSRYKIVTRESEALKRMRNALGLSLKKAAAKSGVHDTIINHAENGWAAITPAFVEKYVRGLGLTTQDWEAFLNGTPTEFDLRARCIQVIKKVDVVKLKALHVVLAAFE